MTANETNCAVAYAADTCYECADGYEIFEGACVTEIEGCITYASATTCETCFDAFDKADDGSACTVKTTIKENCSVHNDAYDACTTCDAGYKVESGACVAQIAGCHEADVQTVDGADYCTKCATGVWATDRGTSGQVCSGGSGDETSHANLAIAGLLSMAIAMTL